MPSGILSARGAMRKLPKAVSPRNLVRNPSFEIDLYGWNWTGGTLIRVNTWAWRGLWSARYQGSTGGGGILAHVNYDQVAIEPGRQAGFRIVVNPTVNPGGFGLFGRWHNEAGAAIGGYFVLAKAPRDSGNFFGTIEHELRGISPVAPPGAAYGLFGLYSINGGTYDFLIDAALVTQDLVNREPHRPREGMDICPYGAGDEEEWSWDRPKLPHKSSSVRNTTRVSFARNPSVEVDASKMAGYQTDGVLARDPASRIVPVRVVGDADDGAAYAEWTVVASPTGYALLYFGDPDDLPGTAMPVSNLDVSISVASAKVPSAVPAEAKMYMLTVTFLNSGQYAFAKGYSVTPTLAWQRMAMLGMEEYPASTGVTSVPNTPPRWAMAAIWLTGLTPGAVYTVHTDRVMSRSDDGEVYPNDTTYFPRV